MIQYTQALTRQLSALSKLVDWERADRSLGMDAAFDTLVDLLEFFDNPERQFKTIHIAGTKGKGSVGALIEAGLCRGGIKVGRFSSPHIERYTERFTLGCHQINDDFLAEMIAEAVKARNAAQKQGRVGGAATRFDLEVLAAILAFSSQKVEWAIIECGLGGLNDSTNAIDADIAVLTNVGLEHTAILGQTVVAIAQNKAGIIKYGSTFVTGVPQASDEGKAVHEIATSMQAKEIFLDLSKESSIAQRNIAMAAAVLDEIGNRGVSVRAPDLPSKPLGGWVFDDEVIKTAALPGRMEIFTRINAPCTPIVMDGAHVPFNLEAVLTDLSKISRLAAPCTVIAGFARDKAAEEMISILAQHANRILFTQSSHGPPAFAPETLRLIGAKHGVECFSFDTALDALAEALLSAHGWIFITGSLHIVGELRPLIRQIAT